MVGTIAPPPEVGRQESKQKSSEPETLPALAEKPEIDGLVMARGGNGLGWFRFKRMRCLHTSKVCIRWTGSWERCSGSIRRQVCLLVGDSVARELCHYEGIVSSLLPFK